MKQYGSEKKYNDDILESFGREDGVEILIVVDKLLTGFDEPRNTVLYIDKPLKEHGLLQAIARVNRLFENKDYGFIIDYRGVLGELNEAINVYDALAEFDTDDIVGTITDIGQILQDLPQLHANLWGIFRPVTNKKDTEQLEQYLEPEDIREKFYDALRDYARCFQVAVGSERFYQEVPQQQIATYKRDLSFFHNLRNSVKQRFGETIAYGDYEHKIRKLLDQHIKADGEIQVVTPQVDIFDVDAFATAIEHLEGEAARADTIAHQMKRVITERMEQDPAFYKSFSDLIDEAIAAYKQGRIDEAQYLERIKQQHQQFTTGREDTSPDQLKATKHATAYYGILKDTVMVHLGETPAALDMSADTAIRVEAIIESRKIRDWINNDDVKSQMANDIEDYLFSVKGRHDIPLTYDEIDFLLEQLIYTAIQRDHL